jgi:hypothetical protein
VFQRGNRLRWWGDQVPGNLVQSYLCTFTLECFFPCPVPLVSRKKVGRFTIYNNALCGWFVLLLGSISVPEIARQVRQFLKCRRKKNKGTILTLV